MLILIHLITKPKTNQNWSLQELSIEPKDNTLTPGVTGYLFALLTKERILCLDSL
jgi:hypothetical protein